MTPNYDQTLTRADLTEGVRREVGLSRTECSALVDAVFEAISAGLIRDGKVKLSGFGTFTVLDKAERVGRNPKTGVPVKIHSRRVVTFSASKIFAERVGKSLARKLCP